MMFCWGYSAFWQYFPKKWKAQVSQGRLLVSLARLYVYTSRKTNGYGITLSVELGCANTASKKWLGGRLLSSTFSLITFIWKIYIYICFPKPIIYMNICLSLSIVTVSETPGFLLVAFSHDGNIFLERKLYPECLLTPEYENCRKVKGVGEGGRSKWEMWSMSV